MTLLPTRMDSVTRSKKITTTVTALLCVLATPTVAAAAGDGQTFSAPESAASRMTHAG